MDLTAIIAKTILELPQDEPRKYIGASSIGHACSRAIWYGFHGSKRQPIKPNVRVTFDIGKRLETLPIEYLRKAGFHVTEPTQENSWLFYQDKDVPIFQGHADGLLLMPQEKPAILEIKTAKNSLFQMFKNKGLRAWSPTYYAQAQAYMGMSGYKKAALIAVNKDTSEFHHEWVNFDDEFYSQLKMKALAISTIDEPPERINKSPLFLTCQNCSYKGVCHGS